jgi:serine/threonine-protein kinase RsbW
MSVSARLWIDADPHRLAELRSFVREQTMAANAPAECVEDLVQAVDEAATNVIRHGYRGADGWLEVDISTDGERFVVVIEDGAPPFDPTTVPEPDLTIPPMARRPGGMGVHLIRLAVDSVGYRARPGGGNILSLVRSVAPGRSQEGPMTLTTSVETAVGRVPITIVALSGELDSTNFERFVDEVQTLYQNGTRALILDLTDLTFLASSGLVALHSIVRIMHGQAPIDPESGWAAFHSLGNDVSEGAMQTEVQLAGPQPAITRVLERTGLDRLFPIHPDRETATRAF